MKKTAVISNNKKFSSGEKKLFDPLPSKTSNLPPLELLLRKRITSNPTRADRSNTPLA